MICQCQDAFGCLGYGFANNSVKPKSLKKLSARLSSAKMFLIFISGCRSIRKMPVLEIFHCQKFQQFQKPYHFAYLLRLTYILFLLVCIKPFFASLFAQLVNLTAQNSILHLWCKIVKYAFNNIPYYFGALLNMLIIVV